MKSAHSQTTSFSPERRFRSFEHVVQFFKPNGATFSAILDIARYDYDKIKDKNLQ